MKNKKEETNTQNTFSMSAKSYKTLVKTAKKTTCKEKPQLSGVCIEVSKEAIRFTTLDGYKLAHWVMETSDSNRKEFSYNAPLLEIKAKDSETLDITCTEKEFQVYNRSTQVRTTKPMIKHDYIEYKKVFPVFEKPQSIYLNADYLKSILCGTSDYTNQIKLEFETAVGGHLKPVVITNSGKEGLDYTGFLLPLKVSDEEQSRYDIKI